MMFNTKTTLVAAALCALSVAAHANMDKPSSQSYYNQFSSAYRQPSEVLSTDYVVQVQQALADRGFYRGRVDGVWGSQTTSAFRGFQKSQGDDTPSGIATAEAMDALGINVDDETRNNMKQVGETTDPNMRTNRH